MAKWLQQFKTEDWIIVFLGFIVLGLCMIFPSMMNHIKMVNVKTLATGAGWINTLYTFVFLLIIIYMGAFFSGKPFKGIFLSFLVVFLLTMLAQFCASIPFCKKYGLEAVLFAVFFGLLISNCFKVPQWLKPAIQSEFYIKIGIVCLGATVIFSEIMKSGAYGLAQAIIVVFVVWYFAFWISRKIFHVDDEMATILSSSLSICGVSAAIATCGTIKGDKKKLSYIVSMVMIVAIPMLYLMPLLCKWILNLDILSGQQVAGAWIGGTIDTTAAVAASGGIMGEEAGKTAVIVKTSQNVLIGVAAFLISVYWSVRERKGDTDLKVQKTSAAVIWERFPKFVLGMVVASVVFSIWFGGKTADGLAYKSLAKNFQGIFFSIAFVCIGLETRFKEIFSKENNNSLWAFLSAQTFNIIWTLGVAYLLFGVVKPWIG